MNKSAVLGFVAGIVVLVVFGGGYFLINAMRAVEDIAVTTSQAPAPPAAARPPAAPPTRTATPAEQADPTALHFMRRASGFAEDGSLEVSITLTQQGGEAIRALGIEEALPAGWSFDGIVSGEKPDLSPTSGRTGTLEFAWFNIPSFPATFTYRAKSDGSGEPKEISGQALFRTGGAELRSNVVKTLAGRGTPPAAAPAAAPAGAAAENDAGAKDWPGLRMAQSVAQPFTPGGTGEIRVDLDFGTGDPVMAMAVVQQLPEGWVFDKVTGGDGPAVAPDPGRGGEITFIWIQVPSFPTGFTYSVRVPETAQSADFVTGQTVYRRAGAEERTEEIVLEVPPAA